MLTSTSHITSLTTLIFPVSIKKNKCFSKWNRRWCHVSLRDIFNWGCFNSSGLTLYQENGAQWTKRIGASKFGKCLAFACQQRLPPPNLQGTNKLTPLEMLCEGLCVCACVCVCSYIEAQYLCYNDPLVSVFNPDLLSSRVNENRCPPWCRNTQNPCIFSSFIFDVVNGEIKAWMNFKRCFFFFYLDGKIQNPV